MPNSSQPTEQLITRAIRGEDPAMVELIGQIGPRLRRAVDAELEAVQHHLDAAQMWIEIQDEVKRRIGEFNGTAAVEFEAWAERLALRHIRYSAGGRAANIETIVGAPNTETLAKPAPVTGNADPNGTIAPQNQASSKADPNATIAPAKDQMAKFDPNATLPPGAGDTIAPDTFAIPKHDPNATITDLASIPLAPQTTKIFGDYEILETIAKGGMGVVYKARQRKLNRIVALKMILAGQFADQDDIERFYVEAEAAAQLRHPNIVGIFEVGECDGQHYFSMEYIEGQSLGDLVREHPLTPRDAATFVKAISEAMYYAHQKGVLHRDLKPSNVLVDNDNEPLITDFGLAKRTEEQSVRTMAGSILGTPSYMPPEQASGKLDLISVQSDVYSIGAILYELITGKPPFGAANPWETIKQVINDEPVAPRLLNKSVPADLETICLKCLQKDQARRYSSAQELADELQRFLAGEPILARPIGVVERSIRWCYRNPWPTAALGVLLLGVVGTSVGLKVAIDARGRAVIAQRTAVIAQGKAEASRRELMRAINELFTAWGDVELRDSPGFEPMRKKLLATASELYTRMGEQQGNDPEVQQLLGESYFRLGRMMFHLRSNDESLAALRAARAIQQPDEPTLPDDELQLYALGETLNQLGEVLEAVAVRAGGTVAFEKTKKVYDEAILARAKLADAFPKNFEYRRKLLNSQMNQGTLEQHRGELLFKDDEPEAAQPFYERAQPLIEAVQQGRLELLGQLDETTSAEFRQNLVHDLARSYYNLAKITLWLGQLEATEAHVAAAVDNFGRLLAKEPDNLEYQYDQANCRILGGDAKIELNASRDALKAYESARTTLARLAKESASVPEYRRAVAQADLKIGLLHGMNGQFAKALEAFESQAKWLESLLAEFNLPADQKSLDTAQESIELLKQFIEETGRRSPQTPPI